jgi:hypothetical protein
MVSTWSEKEPKEKSSTPKEPGTETIRGQVEINLVSKR